MLSSALILGNLISCSNNEKYFNINFYVDENIFETIKTKGNEEINLPTPSKVNYEFKGWYFEKEYQTIFNSDYLLNNKITSDIDLYAKFESTLDIIPIKKQINFYVEGAFYHQILTNGNEKLDLPSEPRKKDYTFKGWFLEETFLTPFDINYYEFNELTSSIDVYAKFIKESEIIPIKKQINFYVDDTLYYQILTNGNENFTIPSDPKKEGYIFLGWYLDKDFNNKFDLEYYKNHELTDSLDVYANFKKEEVVNEFEINEEGIITKFNGNKNVVEIPTIINEIEVKGLKDYLFKDNKIIDEVTLPASLKNTGYATFKNATNLKKVTFNGKNIETISASLFENCTSLKEVTLVDSIKYINANSFTSCALTSFIAPKNLISIGNEAFLNNKNLINIDLGNVNKIYRAAFEGCSSLKEVTLPTSLIDLKEDYIFLNCSSLEVINMPTKAKEISKTLFVGTKIFNDETKYINKALYIDDYLIYIKDDFNDEIFKVKEGTKAISKNIFSNFSTLKEVVLPPTIEVISENAFNSCTNLNKVNIPTSVKKIGVNAFYNTLIYKDKANYYNEGFYYQNWLLDISDNLNDNLKHFVVKENTIGIGDGDLLSYSSRNHLETLTFNNNLKYIGSKAFINTKISALNIPTSLTYIGFESFYNTNILEVNIPTNCIIEENSFNKETIINRI